MAKVSAIFDTHAEAERAVSDLRTLGLSDSDLSVIAHHGGTTTARSGDGEITDEHHRDVLRGKLGAGLGVAALAIPGVSPIAAAGAIAASAIPEAVGIGAAVGAIGGTMNEALTKHGVSKEDASYYGDRMKDGAVVVTLEDTGIEAESVRSALYRNGGHNPLRPVRRPSNLEFSPLAASTDSKPGKAALAAVTSGLCFGSAGR